jgi:phage shock protein PspC (stress-responsive transcriptional regulator)
MNEIKRIHLGRQPFEISVDAHKALLHYLQAIKLAVGDSHKEVIEEVELRMAELLMERGITSEKTVIASDVEYLKEQLGEPRDFKTDDDTNVAGVATEQGDGRRRLFRDPQDAIIGGVSSGLGAYFGVQAPLVRIAFVIMTLLWGWGILLYVILWLVMPEAKTSSERLQMQGKPVTVESLKEMVDDADVKTAANRVGGFVRPLIHLAGKLALIAIGVGFVLLGVFGLVSAFVGAAYAMLYQHSIFVFGDFTLSMRDTIFGSSVVLAVMLISVAHVLAGIAIVRRKWLVPSWVTAAGVAGFFVSSIVAIALAPGAIDKVQRYADDIKNRQVVQVETFNKLRIISGNQDNGIGIGYTYVADATNPADYRIQYDFNGEPQLKKIEKTTEAGTLTIDTQDFVNNPDCRGFCFIGSHELRLTIHGPALESIAMEGETGSLAIPDGLDQPALAITVERSNSIDIGHLSVDKLSVTANQGTGLTSAQLAGLKYGRSVSGNLTISDHFAMVPMAKEAAVQTDRVCRDGNGDDVNAYSNPVIVFDRMPEKGITINDMLINSARELRQRQGDAVKDNPLHCVTFNELYNY